MLVTMDPNSGPQSRAPSIMDSPTLARVERARIRLEAQALNNNENHSLERRILDPKVSHTYTHKHSHTQNHKNMKSMLCRHFIIAITYYHIADSSMLTH